MQKKIVWILILAISISFLPFPKQNLAYSKTQDELRQELAEIELQIAQQEKELSGIQGEKKTIQNRLNLLKKEQAALQLKIKATNLKVQELDNKITETEQSIDETNQKIEELKPRLAEAVRQVYEEEQLSLLEILILNGSLSEAVDKIEQLNVVSENLLDVANQMRAFRSNLESKQVVLEDQHEETKNLLSIQGLQQQEYKVKMQEQDTILTMTAAQEAEYQTLLADARGRASLIRARLYELAGGGSTNVTFGEAVELAKWAANQTGVRAAFLLAILTQESNLGKNVGTCNRAGDPPEKSWRVIMSPKRDHTPYLQITQELGLDPDTTPLSCPMRDRRTGKQIGWGGAMGPAQFIPSTWMAYRDRVAAITAKPANPWDIRDAFLASAIKLGGSGAVGNGEAGEWRAAMLYFSGSTNPRFRFYGDSVLNIARRYQAEVEALN